MTNQPRAPSLTRVFAALRIHIFSVNSKDWSDWADFQTDLSSLDSDVILLVTQLIPVYDKSLTQFALDRIKNNSFFFIFFFIFLFFFVKEKKVSSI